MLCPARPHHGVSSTGVPVLPPEQRTGPDRATATEGFCLLGTVAQLDGGSAAEAGKEEEEVPDTEPGGQITELGLCSQI